MRGSSCRGGASLSGSVLVPVSSKNEAVGVEMKNEAWATREHTQMNHSYILFMLIHTFSTKRELETVGFLFYAPRYDTESNTPVWPQLVPLSRCWWRGRNLGQMLSQCRYLVTGVWNNRHPLLEEHTWGENERWKHPTRVQNSKTSQVRSKVLYLLQVRLHLILVSRNNSVFLL